MAGPKIDWSKFSIVPDYDSQDWWEFTKEGKLMARFCDDCNHAWWPPSSIGCSSCGNFETTTWKESKGSGTVHSFIVVTQPILGAVVEAVPYVAAIIELDDLQHGNGTPVMLQGIVDESEEQVGIGSRLDMYWETVSDDGKQNPRWKLSSNQPSDIWLWRDTASEG